MDRVNERVTGTIGLKLYKGHARVVTRSSPNAVYDAALASFARVRRAVLADRLARLHRAVVAAVADGLAAAQRDAGAGSRGMARLGLPAARPNPRGGPPGGYVRGAGTQWAALAVTAVAAACVAGARLRSRARAGPGPRAL